MDGVVRRLIQSRKLITDWKQSRKLNCDCQSVAFLRQHDRSRYDARLLGHVERFWSDLRAIVREITRIVREIPQIAHKRPDIVKEKVRDITEILREITHIGVTGQKSHQSIVKMW
jgi:hypothetical protein